MEQTSTPVTSRRPKAIVLCSDGTGNSGVKDRGTNVFKLFEALDLHGHLHNQNRRRQVAFYDDGVGTEQLKLLKVLGGAFGFGLGRNVRQLYTALVGAYNPGDEIYLFGFSRGAFTVRTLAGLIVGCGIVDRKRCKSDKELHRAVRETYSAYRRRYAALLQKAWAFLIRSKTHAATRADIRKRYNASHHSHRNDSGVHIKFIGVWDTVDAVGLPFDHLTKLINLFLFRFTFPDSKLSKLVDRACHAISIDDERHTFHPVMWQHRDDDHQRIEQVWFAGVHSNVGGGYPKQGMSLVALHWMMTRAHQSGLRFLGGPEKYHGVQNVNDKLYDSRSGGAFFYRYKPRNISEHCTQSNLAPKVHVTAFDRALLGTQGYSPGNIPINASVVSTDPAIPPADTQRSIQDLFVREMEVKLGKRKSPLALLAGAIRIRRFAHYVFLGLVVAFVVAAFRMTLDEVDGLVAAFNRLRTVDGVVQAIRSPAVWPWLAGVGLFYLVALITRKRMDDMFSRLWFRLRRADNDESPSAATQPSTPRG